MNPPSRRVEWQAGFWFLLNDLAMVVVGAMVPTLFSAVVFAVGTMHGCSRIERLSAAGWGASRCRSRNDLDRHDR